MPLRFSVVPRAAHSLLDDKTIQIPDHQRPEIWETWRKQALVETILDGRPMPNLTIRRAIEGGAEVNWLEDGQQRYWSMVRYTQDAYAALLPSGIQKKYSELTPVEKATFDYYPVYIMTYEGATASQTFRMFQDLQSSKPLTPGQRFHAMSSVSPIVQFAKEHILEGTGPIAVRARKVFGLPDKPIKGKPGSHGADNKRCVMLQNAMVIAAGVCLGEDLIKSSYDEVGPHLMRPVPAEALTRLQTLVEIYEFVDDARKWPKTLLKKYQWPVGRLTGFILWSIIVCGDADTDPLMEAWSRFLLYARADVGKLHLLTNTGAAISRNLTKERWSSGFAAVFVGSPDAPRFDEKALAVDTVAVSDYEDSDSEN
jgi:hypothetical protein